MYECHQIKKISEEMPQKVACKTKRLISVLEDKC